MVQTAARIFVGGTIETVTHGTAEAVAVGEGRIIACGNREDVLAHRGNATDVVDLRGAALLPGFVEPHTHPDLCGQLYSWVDVSGFTHSTVDGVERALRDAAAAAPPGEWIYAFGLDPMLTDDIGTWDRERLDRLAPHNPVAVMIQSMHTLFVNSAALAEAGVDENTPDPTVGRYGRDEHGRLTGRAEEMGAMLAFLVHDLPTRDRARALVREQYDVYAAVGITTIGMAGAFLPPDHFDLFAELAAAPDVPLRMVAYLRHDEVPQSRWRPGEGDDRFRVAGVKLWYDGSPYTGTMLLDEPYLASDLCCCVLGIPEGTVGYANFDPDELVDLVADLGADGWQIITHAQGDRGCREILDLYERALDRIGHGADHRWRLEHCALISGDDLRRSARLGVSPSFHVNHVRYYGPELDRDILGHDRADRLMPIADALAEGLRVSLHADSPMYPPGPLSLMGTAVTRSTRLGDRLGADQAIDVGAALRAVTIDAAWQLGMDHEVGSIEPAKRADFVVLSDHPARIDPDGLTDLEVIGTYLDGVPIAAA